MFTSELPIVVCKLTTANNITKNRLENNRHLDLQYFLKKVLLILAAILKKHRQCQRRGHNRDAPILKTLQ